MFLKGLFQSLSQYLIIFFVQKVYKKTYNVFFISSLQIEHILLLSLLTINQVQVNLKLTLLSSVAATYRSPDLGTLELKLTYHLTF